MPSPSSGTLKTERSLALGALTDTAKSLNLQVISVAPDCADIVPIFEMSGRGLTMLLRKMATIKFDFISAIRLNHIRCEGACIEVSE